MLPIPPSLETLTRNLTQRIPAHYRPELANGYLHLPPGLRTQLAEATYQLRKQLGPLWQQVATLVRQQLRKAKATGPSATLGSTFASLCVVGLNRSELHLNGEKQAVFADGWQEMLDPSMRRRNTALIFFAPRDLQGQPADPYLFLSGEGVASADDATETGATRQLAASNLGALALLDFCRMSAATPNTVNLMVAADCIFHWDVKDSYVLPTQPTTWARDVEDILRNYPRTTKAVVFTNWDADLLNLGPRLAVQPLRDVSLDFGTWLNKPTVQEQYGSQMLTFGILLALLVGAGLWWQGSALDTLEEQLGVAQQQVPRGGQFVELEKAITEQEKWLATRPLLALAARDTARGLQNSGFKVANFEVKNPDSANPPKQLLITLEASGQDYPGWLQQEPIARSFLLSTALLQGVRKAPTSGTGSSAANSYRLEGLIEVAPLLRDYKQRVKPVQALVARPSAAASPSTPAAAQASSAAPTAPEAATTPDNTRELLP
jgi:hypothetical protein